MLTDGRTDDGRTDGRMTDARVTGTLIAHLGAFGSGELKTRHSSLIVAAVVCVYWYTGLPFVCYMKIFAFKMLSMKIFFQILFVWQETDLVFNSEFEKKK